MANTDESGCALLDYIRRVEVETFKKCVDTLDVDEWRVAFAGQLYPRSLTGKHRGPWSEARLLMEEPFEIVTCVGLPCHGNEQLCVRLPVLPMQEQYETSTITGGDSRKVLDELLSVLCLLTRAKLRIITRTTTYVSPADLRQDLGPPEARRVERIVRARMPQALAGNIDDEAQMTGARCDLDGSALGTFLRKLADDEVGDVFVAAARTFASAIELQDHRPEVAFLLLVSSVESLAGAAYDKWVPPLEDMRRSRKAVVDAALGLSLSDPQIESIVRASCANEHWLRRKFARYMAEHVTKTVACPGLPLQIDPANISDAARAIYDARSTMTHASVALPSTASYGGGPMVPIRTVAALTDATAEGRWDPKRVPPVAWLTRAVAVAHRSFISKRLGIERCPAGECADGDSRGETP